MKRVFAAMFVSAMLVTLGFAQAPDTGSNPDPVSVKGCLGGSDGNYTVLEDGTGQTFKITTSSVDLKPHLGHDAKLVGHKASGAATSAAGFAVTELSMISEHCAAAAAAAAPIVTPSPETVIPPDSPAAPAAPPAAASAPAVDVAPPVAAPAAAPAVPVSPSATTVTAPVPDAAAPAPTVSPAPAISTPVVEAPATAAPASPSSTTVTSPSTELAHGARTSAHARKLAAKQDAAAAAPATTVNPSSDAVVAEEPAPPVTPASPSSATVNPADAAVPAPAPAVTHRVGSLTLLISFVVLIIVLGTTAPLIGRWRKRKMLERDGSPNLSFTSEENTNKMSTKETVSDTEKPEPSKAA